MDDELYMRQALALACLAEGDTSPNPMVQLSSVLMEKL